MASAKRKTPSTKRTTVKKTRKTPAKKAVARQKKVASDFWTVKFTVNTLYWLIIGVAVVSTAFITFNTNQQVNELYDQIDQQQRSLEEYLSQNKQIAPAPTPVPVE
jgi:cell division protein FtsL